MSQNRFLRVRERKIEYQWFEPLTTEPDRPVIVMLHEGLGSVSLWKDFPAHLATAASARIVAYSRFGYGESDAPPEPYGVEMHQREALEVLPEVLRQLEIDRPLLFGHSDGASIAIIYAGTTPRNVAGLVVEAPHVFVEDMCIASIEEARRTYLTTDLRQRLGRHHGDPDRAFRLWNDVWLDPAFRAWNIERHLPPITCPLLAIQGYQDEYGTMEQLDRIARLVPQTALLKLDQCRHSPHRDQPSAVMRSVTQWIAGVISYLPPK